MKKFLVVFMLVFIFMLVVWVPSVSYMTKINIGSYTLEVPSAYRPNTSIFSWFKSVTGIGENVTGFIFEFKAGVVGDNVAGYIRDVDGVEQKIVGLVTYITSEERERVLRNLSYKDAWEGSGGYKSRHIEKDKATGYYLVTEKEGYWGIFKVFHEKPVQKNVPRYAETMLMSSCSGSPLYPFKKVRCTEKLLSLENILIEYSYSYENIASHQEIRNFIKSKVDSWQKKRQEK